MRRSRFSEEQIIGVLREHEAGMKPSDLCRKHGISETTLYKWKAEFGGMTVPGTARLRTLEEENRRLKKLSAEQRLDNAVPKHLLGKNRSCLQTGSMPCGERSPITDCRNDGPACFSAWIDRASSTSGAAATMPACVPDCANS